MGKRLNLNSATYSREHDGEKRKKKKKQNSIQIEKLVKWELDKT